MSTFSTFLIKQDYSPREQDYQHLPSTDNNLIHPRLRPTVRHILTLMTERDTPTGAALTTLTLTPRLLGGLSAQHASLSPWETGTTLRRRYTPMGERAPLCADGYTPTGERAPLCAEGL